MRSIKSHFGAVNAHGGVMFSSLIRRRPAAFASGSDETAFESTTVSLSTDVPRPVERRTEERVSAMLRVGKLTSAGGEDQLIRVRNLSAGGLAAIVTRIPQVGDR